MPSSGPEGKGDTGSAGFVFGSSSVESQSSFSSEGKKGQFKTIFNPSYWKLAAWGQVLVKNLASRGQAIWRLELGLKLKVIKRQIK